MSEKKEKDKEKGEKIEIEETRSLPDIIEMLREESRISSRVAEAISNPPRTSSEKEGSKTSSEDE